MTYVMTDEHRRNISKARKGWKVPEETRAKISATLKAKPSGPHHALWKPSVGAHACHAWMLRNHPKTGTCELCGARPERKRRSPTQFAFKHHPDPHTRNREDYYEVCIPCHRALDRESYIRGRATL